MAMESKTMSTNELSGPLITDHVRPVADTLVGGPNTSTHLGQASLSEVRHLNNLTSSCHNHTLPDVTIENDHSVRKGETLSEIAMHQLGKGASKHDIYDYVKKLAKENHLGDPNHIGVEQTIHFPSIEGYAHRPTPPLNYRPSQPPKKDHPAQPSPTDKPAQPPHTDHPAQPSPTDKPAQPPHTDHPAQPSPTDKPAQPPHTDHPAQPSPTDKPAQPAPKPAEKHQESGFMGFLHKAEAVASDIAAGAVDEVVHHPGEVLKNVAIGAAVGIGAALVAPEVAIVGAVAGVGLGAYEVAKHAGDWIQAGSVVANQQGHTASEIQAAHEALKGVGRGVTDTAAGFVGGAVGTIGAKIAGEAIAGELGSAGRAAAGRVADSGAGAERPAVKPAERMPLSAEHPIEGVRVGEPEPYLRTYEVNGKQHQLVDSPEGWFYGKNTSTVGDVKLHVAVTSPADLAQLQRVMIPFLNDNPEASALAKAWKTFDPKLGFDSGDEAEFGPRPSGQNAKGFTIYTENTADAVKLQQLIDKQLISKGLGLPEAPKTGNVDIVEGQSNRLGTVRDHFPSTRDARGNNGAKLDQELSQHIENQYGNGVKLNNHQLRAVEEEAGLKPGTLTYDKNGELMLQLIASGRPSQGKVYVTEGGAKKTFGQLTDRPAMYSLANLFHWNPANGVK